MTREELQGFCKHIDLDLKIHFHKAVQSICDYVFLTVPTVYSFGSGKKGFLVEINGLNGIALRHRLFEAAAELGKMKGELILAAKNDAAKCLEDVIYLENWGLSLFVNEEGTKVKLSERGYVAITCSKLNGSGIGEGEEYPALSEGDSMLRFFKGGSKCPA